MFMYVFLFLSFLVPNHYLPWKSFYNEAMAFAFLLTACFVFRAGRIGPVAWAVLGVLVFSFLQYFFGVIHYFSTVWLVVCYLGAAVLAYALGARKGTERDSAYTFSWVFLAAGLVSAWIALSQWFDTSQFLFFGFTGEAARVTGNLAQANHLATLSLLAVASVLYLRQSGVLSAATFTLCSLLLLLVLALTQSRMGALGFLLFIGVWFIKSRGKSVIGWKSALLLVAWFFFFFFFSKSVAEFLLLSSGAPGIERFMAADRLDIWNQSICAIRKSPLMGYGVGQSGSVQYLMAVECPLQMLSLHSHNLVLELLVWLGPVFGGGIVIFCFWRAWSWWREANGFESTYMLCSIAILSLHALLEYPLEYSYFLIPFFWFVGALDSRRRAIVLPAKFMLFTGLLGGLMFGVTFWEYQRAEEDFRNVRLEFARLAKPSEGFRYFILDDISEQLFVARFTPYSGMDDKLIERIRVSTYLNPYAPFFKRYVQSLVLNERHAEALDAVLRFKSIYGDAAYNEFISQFEDVRYMRFRELLENNGL